MATSNSYEMQVTFGRKKQVAPYEMAEASVTLIQTFAGDTDPESVATVMQDAFVAAKSEVQCHLGATGRQKGQVR